MAAAGGIALINSLGNLSGFGGPYITGWLNDLTGDAKAGDVGGRRRCRWPPPSVVVYLGAQAEAGQEVRKNSRLMI